MSPYFDTPAVIMEAAKLEQYPPLFSVFLALSGISHSYLASHIVVALMFTTALLLSYWLSIRILNNRPLALMVTLLFALIPSVWLNMLGILSENMYIILSLGFILLYNYQSLDQNDVNDNDNNIVYNNFNNNVNNNVNNVVSIQLTGLLTLVILCRSLGVALIAAYAICVLLRNKNIKSIADWRFLLPVLLPLLAAASWALTHDSGRHNLYTSDVSGIFMDVFTSTQPVQHFFTAISPQLSSFYASWHTAFILYWFEGLQATHIIVSLFGVCVLAGLVLRLKQNQLDAWYILFYLLILLVWPYPDQFNRFIYVLMPLFIINGVYFIKFLAEKFAPKKTILSSSIALVFVLIAVAPASAFIVGRANYTTPYENMDFSHVAPFYNIPDIDTASRVAYRHEHLRQDLEKLKTTVAESDVTMWYTPNYISLVAQRKAVRFPATMSGHKFLQDVRDSKADYVFASGLIPRYTAEAFNGLQVIKYFSRFTDVVWFRKHPKTNQVVSILLKINQQKLSRQLMTTQQ